jgi:predicted glycosyltransferase
MHRRFAFVVHTPGQAHLWSNVIKNLTSKGKDTYVISRGGMTEEILSRYDIKHVTYSLGSKTIYGKVLLLPSQFASCFKLISRFHPDIIVGSGIIESDISALLVKPCVIFEDTEVTSPFERSQYKITANSIISPDCFTRDLGKKHILVPSFKELSYLHPDYFKPDLSIFDELGIAQNEKYVVLRFNSWGAVHDIGLKGFSEEDKYKLIEELEKYVKVFVISEGYWPQDLNKYKMPTPPHRIHHVLAYAQMVVTDTGTMTVEAAMLGTPAIVCQNVGDRIGNFNEVEKYGLLHLIKEPKEAIAKAIELIQQQDLKKRLAQKRQKLLSDKINMADFMVDFLENYPESIAKFNNASGFDKYLKKDAS